MTLLTGFAKRKITREDPTILAGIFSSKNQSKEREYLRKRVGKEVLDDVFTRSITFSDGQKKVALCNVDLLITTRDLYQRVLDRLSQRGLDDIDLMLTATHTHFSYGQYWDNWGAETFFTGKYDPAVFEHLVNNITDCIVESQRDLKPSKIGYKSTTVKEVCGNRSNVPAKLDEDLKIIKINSEDGAYCIASYSAHPVTLWGNYWGIVSRDYPGVLEDLILQNHEVETIFVPGALAGSGIAYEEPEGKERLERMGKQLYDGFSSVYEGIEPVDDNVIDFSDRVMTMDKTQIDFLNRFIPNEIGNWILSFLADKEFLISGFRLGDIALVGVPGEYGFDMNNSVSDNSPFSNTVCISQTNGYSLGYVHMPEFYDLPPEQRTNLGTYEHTMGLYGRNMGVKLVDSIKEILEDLQSP
jgi:neutral ceramidase